MSAPKAPEAPGAPAPAGTPGELPLPLRLWLAPVREPLRVVAGTADRPVAELTMAELAAWAAVLGYAGLTGLVIGRLAANLALAALRGPVVSRR